ncbi:valine--tRNA ligase [Tropilaelaps mercedesae]|uniref:valine--tRNA ligase n=1 Tax=Tropilaelaps mercedesae TaxID=418985 RepID=A0A1V9XXS6_9ACAR|nr:valine--tRNA ligase [Tropilaelaps mercedesae]
MILEVSNQYRSTMAVHGICQRYFRRKHALLQHHRPCKGTLVTSTKDNNFRKFVSPKLENIYDSERVEEGWAREWAETESKNSKKLRLEDCHQNENKQNNVFRMVLPPPNITGDLHLGHAMTVAIQDSICRYRRLKGDSVVWIPGTDHAGIATQVVLERKIAKEAESVDLPFSSCKGHLDMKNRDHRLKVAAEWKSEKEANIYNQLSRMGASLSWERKLFTLDDTMNPKVSEAFVRLYQRGMIYRGNRLVNWCPALQSTLSDIEVDHIQVQPNQILEGVNVGCMYSFAYPIYEASGAKGEVIVSTGRLETMLADVAVAVHPQDDRYSHLEHLKTLLEHPLTGRKLLLIKDSNVDMKKGTGALKLTPAYSIVDWEICRRHQVLDLIECFDDQGRLTPEGYRGDDKATATAKIRAKLDKLGLYRGSIAVARSIPVCSRTGTLVDQRLKPQWYLRCDDLASRALAEVESGRVQMIPEYHAKVWKNWLNNAQDWCISRQLWWGHRIPAYKLPSSLDKADSWIITNDHKKAISSGAAQDSDVLDTWFSSALYPLVAFGWPTIARPPPLDIIETGCDILYFWLARIMMVSLALTEQTPFKKVVLHGMLRDIQGRKMSKSLGNAIDPLHIIKGAPLQRLQDEATLSIPYTEALFARGYLTSKQKDYAQQQTTKLFPQGVTRCGADALKIALLRCDIQKENISFDVQQCITARNLCNKIWQGVRFYSQAATAIHPKRSDPNVTRISDFLDGAPSSATFDEFDRWILARLHKTQESVKQSCEEFRTPLSINELHKFWLSDFCDVYIEVVKPDVWNVTPCLARRVSVLREVIKTYLVIASPFIPHLTEEIYHKLQLMGGLSREECSSIHHQRWPTTTEQWRDDDVERSTTLFFNALRNIRMVKQREGLLQALKALKGFQLDEKKTKIAHLLCKIKPEQIQKLIESKQIA